MKRLILVALTTLTLVGCDGYAIVKEEPKANDPTPHDVFVHQEYEKLKTDVTGRFVTYIEGSYDNGSMYVLDTKTGCEYADFPGDIRSGYNLIEGSCNKDKESVK